MELKHQFTVPAGVEETWAAFNDIEGVAQCFPGATVTSVEGDTFQGTVKVKLGPIQMLYNGTGTFAEKDESARRMVIEAKGKDKRGNGTAGADVVAVLSPEGESTRVEVTTDLAITGKPAQFGRGVIQDVSDKLLGQFIVNLEQRLGAGEAAETADQDAGPASQPTGAAATPEAAGDQDSGPASVPEPGAGAAPRAASTAAPSGGGQAPPLRAASPPPGARSGPQAGSADDALDLGATVLPVLAKAYWKQLLAVVVVLWLLRRLTRRS